MHAREQLVILRIDFFGSNNLRSSMASDYFTKMMRFSLGFLFLLRFII